MESSVPRDALPYTEEFDRLRKSYQRLRRTRISDQEFWTLVSKIGKYGGLSRGGRKTAPRTRSLTTEQQLEILRLFPEGIGARDSLPYTPEFDSLHRQFSAWTKTRFTKHEFWRSVSRVGKLSRKPKPLFDDIPLGGLPEDTVNFLDRQNPWWKAQHTLLEERFRRDAYTTAVDKMFGEIAPVTQMRGPRQVGKTTIQKQIIEELLFIDNVKPKNIFRIQFDDVPALGSLTSPVETLIRWYEKMILGRSVNEEVASGTDVYFFFDEIQNLPSWSSQVKVVADHTRAKVLVTGSSALRIAKGQDSLAGRVAQIDLGPLTLTEILGVRRVKNALGEFDSVAAEEIVDKEFWLNFIDLTDKHRKEIDVAVSYYSELGGYPVCHNATDAYASDLADLLIDGVINKAIDHDPVRLSSKRSVNRHVAKELFRIICRYAGQPITNKQFSQQLAGALGKGVKSDEINDGLAFLEETMLVRRVRQLEMLCKKNDGCCKYCICDPFVRNSFIGEEIPLDPSELSTVDQAVASQAGHLIESCVGHHCSRIPRVDLSWVREKGKSPEIDFVLTVGDKRIPIEIKYVSRKVRPADYKAVAQFASNSHYGADFGLIATQRQSCALTDKVLAVRAMDLLLL